jgi:hypothetical protein
LFVDVADVAVVAHVSWRLAVRGTIVHNARPMSILTFVVAIAVGTLLVFLFSRWIGRVKFTFANAFWGSAIGHILPAIVALGLGFLLHEYLGFAFIIGLVIALAFQSVLFQIIARTQNEVLRAWRAMLIALIVILGDFLIASPIVELVQRGTGG